MLWGKTCGISPFLFLGVRIMRRIHIGKIGVSEGAVLDDLGDVLVDWGGFVLLSNVRGVKGLCAVPLGGGDAGMWRLLEGGRVVGKVGYHGVLERVISFVRREIFGRGGSVRYRVYGDLGEMSAGELKGEFGWYFRDRG